MAASLSILSADFLRPHLGAISKLKSKTMAEKTVSNLEELFYDLLKDTYDAEHQLLEAIPKMAKAANDPELSSAFTEHLEQTKNQVTRLEQAFSILSWPAERKKCVAMEGLLKEGSEVIKKDMEPSVKDAALIAAAQKVEHYEIASYGTLCTWASLIGQSSIEDLLGDSLEEEKDTDERLTDLAEGGINEDAENGDTFSANGKS